MDPITQQTVLAAAGAGGEKIYVDDVFSTYLWNGNYDTTRSAITINNGIDLAGEGGLVWTKNRNYGNHHQLFDTERGAGNVLYSSLSSGQGSNSVFNSFNSNGFSLNAGTAGTDALNGDAADTYASWTFRKAPGFFDVVTWSGNSTAGRQIPHALGSTPGMIIVKRLTATENWYVYHRSLGATKYLKLSTNDSVFTGTNQWNDTAPTSTHFTVGTDTSVNTTGSNYVAYIFAHDDAQYGTDGAQSIIKCGSYTGTASAGNFVNLGFEPQWVMLKSTASDNPQPWFIVDNIRLHEDKQYYFFANDNQAENDFNLITFNSTGFSIEATGNGVNKNNSNYIYIAIRRSHKPPEAGTDVFAVDTRGGTSPNPPTYNSGFPVDVVWSRDTTSSNWQVKSRLTGDGQILKLNSSDAEYTNQSGRVTFDRMDGIGTDTGVDSANYSWMFKRAQGCMDVVAYSGFGSNSGSFSNISHNLDVAPQMIWVKSRDDVSSLGGAGGWHVYHSGVNKEFLYLNSTSSGGSPYFITGTTSTTFTVRDHPNTGYTGKNYIAFLFATLPGISKVGSYSGNTSNAIDVNCGFTAGARFILIKRMDSTGDWYVWDTTRGIVSGDDPYLFLNDTAAQVTNTDYIDPLSSGFTVTSSAPAALNVTGGTYIFLAIA